VPMRNRERACVCARVRARACARARARVCVCLCVCVCVCKCACFGGATSNGRAAGRRGLPTAFHNPLMSTPTFTRHVSNELPIIINTHTHTHTHARTHTRTHTHTQCTRTHMHHQHHRITNCTRPGAVGGEHCADGRLPGGAQQAERRTCTVSTPRESSYCLHLPHHTAGLWVNWWGPGASWGSCRRWDCQNLRDNDLICVASAHVCARACTHTHTLSNVPPLHTP
jgi:hypothetical protein